MIINVSYVQVLTTLLMERLKINYKHAVNAYIWKPQTDIPIPISNFNITGLYGVLTSVLSFPK